MFCLPKTAWPPTSRTWRTEIRRLCLRCSPLRLLCRCGSQRRKRPACDLRRSRHLETAFRSPEAAARLKATSPGSLFPACSFDALAESGFATRSIASSFPRAGFPWRGSSSPTIRCRFRSRHSSRLSRPCSPSGPFDPSGSSLDLVRLPEACLHETFAAGHSPTTIAFRCRRKITVSGPFRSA